MSSLRRPPCLAALLAVLCALWLVGGEAWAKTGDQAVTLQLDAAHSGSMDDAGVAPPLVQQWSVDLGEAEYPLIVNGVVYVNTPYSGLYAYRQRTGTVLWHRPTRFPKGVSYDRGRLFGVTWDDVLEARDAVTGAAVWTQRLPVQFSSRIATPRGGVVYVVGSLGSISMLYALRERDGRLLWSRSTTGTPVPAVDDHGIYLSSGCGGVTAWTPDGTSLWSQAGTCSGGDVLPVAEGVVWAPGRMYAQDDGSDLGAFSTSMPAVHDGRAFVSEGSDLRAIPAPGSVAAAWQITAPARLATPPLALGDAVFVATSDGTLMARDAVTGGDEWSASVGDSGPGSMAASNGTLVLLTDHKVIAYRSSGSLTVVPVNRASPTIDGASRAGHSLVADVGLWSALPDHYTYQWQRCDADGTGCHDVADATAMSYVPPASDAGSAYRVAVTAVNSTGASAAVSSAPTTPLQPAVPSNLTAPVVSGEARVGHTLSATAGTWTGDPDSYSYTWYICDQYSRCELAGPQPGGPEITVSVYDIGRHFVVEVTAINDNGESDLVRSAPTDDVPLEAPRPLSPPQVSGAFAVGKVLSATTGTWEGDVFDYNYQWFRCDATGNDCHDIPGATDSTYEVTASDLGSYLGVEVVASNRTGAGTADSEPFGPVELDVPSVVVGPRITGELRAGQALTVDPGSWRNAPTGFSYHWSSCRTPDTQCDHVGDGGATLVLSDTDVGRYIAVVVSSHNAAGLSNPARVVVGPIAAPASLPAQGIATPPPHDRPPTSGGPVSAVAIKVLGSRVDRAGVIRVDLFATVPGNFRGVATIAKPSSRRGAPAQTITFGSDRATTGEGSRSTLRLHPTRRGRAALRGTGRLSVAVAVTFKPYMGPVHRAAFTIKIRRHRR